MADARTAALDVVRLVNRGRHLQEALNTALETLPAQKRQLCAELAYGYFRQDERLHYILKNYLPRPQKLSPEFKILLAFGLYGLLFQDQTPAYAVLDETVASIKKIFGQRLAGVANGVLRNAQRELDELSSPAWYMAQSGDEWLGLSIFYAIPQRIATLWKKAYGEEMAIKLMIRSSSRPYVGLRLNPGHPEAAAMAQDLQNLAAEGQIERIGDQGYAFAPGACPDWLIKRSEDSPHARGVFSWQSAGSMMIMDKLQLMRWEEPVWDCCAGVGGKTLPLLEKGQSVSLASDTSAKRLFQLKKDCARLRLPIPALAVCSAARPPFGKWRGNILIDAPCSGLGVLSRRPDLRRSRWTPESFKGLQLEILLKAQACLVPGGELAYITCTLNPDENEKLVETALAQCPRLTLKRMWQTPHDHPWLEGMFGAVLSKD